MSDRAKELADRLAQANGELLATIEGCSDEQWKAACEGEGWSVGVTAHHVASSHGAVTGLARAIADGRPVPPISMDDIHRGNEQHAREHANCTRDEAADLLRTNGDAAVAMVRGLSDEQLDRSASVAGNHMSVATIVEGILIGHARSHLGSIRAALAS